MASLVCPFSSSSGVTVTSWRATQCQKNMFCEYEITFYKIKKYSSNFEVLRAAEVVDESSRGEQVQGTQLGWPWGKEGL